MRAAMRTIIALSGISLVVFTALVGKELVDDDEPPRTANAPPPGTVAASSTRYALPTSPNLATGSSATPAAERTSSPKRALVDALQQELDPLRLRATVISELERSGSNQPAFRERGSALGAALVASQLVSGFHCFAAGCYFELTTELRPEQVQIVIRERNKHAPDMLIAITAASPPNNLVVLLNNNEVL
jgi:hypothetical protein